MPLNKELGQVLIDDFAFSNIDELNKISKENKPLFNATMDALLFLSKKFGTGQVLLPQPLKEEPEKELNFKVGDVFFRNMPEEKDKKAILYTIKSIDLASGKAIMNINFTERAENKEVERDINTISEDVEVGWWMPISKIEQITFNVGDKFKRVSSGEIYVISKMKKDAKDNEDNAIDLAYSKDGFPYRSFSKDDIIQYLMEGLWTKFEEGAAAQPNSQLGFSVGDRFNISKTTLNFTIEHVSNTDVGLIYDDGLTGVIDLSSFSDGLRSGYYLPIKVSEFKVGDLILFPSNYILSIEDINTDGRITLGDDTAVRAKKIGTTVDELKENLKYGKLTKLEFRIGDSFETTRGGVKTIISRTGNVFDVENNNDPSQIYPAVWDVIINRITTGEWKKLVFTEPKSTITPDLSQAQPNATQQMMAKATSTPTATASGTAFTSAKLPKKTASKEEKAIKALQKEIDGLELIADFDDEAKAELENKLKEIKALKSKIS